MKKLFLLLFAGVLLINISGAQNKYALLFGGDYNENNTALEAVWNDMFLMNELLLNNGFQQQDIHMLFQYGYNYYSIFSHNDINERYIYKPNGDQLTCHKFSKDSFTSEINNIKEQINANDDAELFLLLTYAHGEPDRITCSGYNKQNSDTYITSSELNTMLSSINCKKLVLMQNCYSGSFIDEVQNENTLLLTATNDSCAAKGPPPDQKYFEVINNDSVEFYAPDESESYSTDTHKHQHSEWFLHLYASLAGHMPNDTNFYEIFNTDTTLYKKFYFSEGDLNSDSIISMTEATKWNEHFNSCQKKGYGNHSNVGDDPQISDSVFLGRTTSLRYPTFLPPEMKAEGTFIGPITILNDIHILSGDTMTLEMNASFNPLGDYTITVEDGGVLIINGNIDIPTLLTVEAGGLLKVNDNSTIELTDTGKINVFGEVNIGKGVSLTSEPDNSFGGVNFLNVNSSVVLNSFNSERSSIVCESNSLEITNSNFNQSGIECSSVDIDFNNITFNESYVSLIDGPSSTAEIKNCIFKNYDSNPLYIDSYNQISIENCTIENNGGNGIYLFKSNANLNLIRNNTINNNGLSGICLFDSKAEIDKNYSISENQYGILLLGTSVSKITGDENASSSGELQKIRDNTINQIYASESCFPYEIHYNYIDCVNYTDPFVYYSGPCSDSSLNVENNYWGKRDIHSNEDIFFPFKCFDYEPFITFIMPMPRESKSQPEFLYSLSKESVNIKDYHTAKQNLKIIVEEYSDSKYALPALNEMFIIEGMGNKDYDKLKSYYMNYAGISENRLLSKISVNLAARCDIKMKNYQSALNYFDDVINKSETLEDYVFAAIDLGYTYLLMKKDGYSYSAKHNEFTFNSTSEFEKKREELIKLLLSNNPDKLISLQNENKESQMYETEIEGGFNIYPNPVTNHAVIQYSLDQPSDISIKIFDYTGKTVKIIVDENQDSNHYRKSFSTDDLKQGIYFCSIEINGKLKAKKKIVVIK